MGLLQKTYPGPVLPLYPPFPKRKAAMLQSCTERATSPAKPPQQERHNQQLEGEQRQSWVTVKPRWANEMQSQTQTLQLVRDQYRWPAHKRDFRVTQVAIIKTPVLKFAKCFKIWKDRWGRGEKCQDTGRGRWNKIVKAAIRIQTITFSCWKLHPQPKVVKEANLVRCNYLVRASQKPHLHSAELRQTGIIRISNSAGAIIYSSVSSHCPLTQKPSDTYFKYSNTRLDFK